MKILGVLFLALCCLAANATAQIVTFSVPDDYSTIDDAVMAARVSYASKVVIYAPDQTWNVNGKSIQWFEQMSPELSIVGGGVSHPVLIDGKGGELLWETSSLTLQYVNVQDIQILLYGNAKFTTLANVEFLNTPNGTFPYPMLYMEGSAVCDLSLSAGGINRLDMNDIALLVSSRGLRVYSEDVSLRDRALLRVAGDIVIDGVVQ